MRDQTDHTGIPRRQFVKQLGAAGAALAAGPTAGLFAQEATPRRPNIIFLLADDMRWDAMGCMGNRFVRTPHLDRLAAQGVLFENAFVTTSICAPNRACILAGQHQRTTGIKNGRLAMATRHNGKLTLVVARPPLPKGEVEVAGRLAKDGTIMLEVAGSEAASGKAPGPIGRTPGDPIMAGGDHQTPIGDYAPPSRFPGVIRSLVVRVDD